jgi:farnesyl-diphosphate farnesyltransferase
MSDSEIEPLLQKTSRTFALTIPLLPEPNRREVSVAYLLFRIIDTFEDATLWGAERQRDAIARFGALLGRPPGEAAELVALCAGQPPLEHEGYLELLSALPQVLAAFQELRPRARASIRRAVRRSAKGMSAFVTRAGAAEGRLELTSLDELHGYCYVVAGIVGEMLTDLFLLGRPHLAPVGDGLKARAAEFGEGLQLVNILKDAKRDEAEGRVYLPRGVPLGHVLGLAERDLGRALQYVDLLRSAGAEAGVVAFNTFISKLAIANLQILRERGLGAKLSRLEVARVAAEVAQAVRQLQPPTAPL